MQPITIDDCRPNSFIILFGSNSNVNCSGGIEEIAYGVNQSDYLTFSVFFIGTTTGSIR